MFVKMSLRDRPACLVDYIGMTLLCSLPLPNCFLKVCIPTLCRALDTFLPLTTSSISGAANSIKSATTRFPAGTIYLCKNGIVVLPITSTSETNLLPRCRPKPL